MERHEAIVAGAGPAGLACAAQLKRRGLEVLVLERTDAVGARWRKRYAGLRLNTMRQLSSLPGFRMRRSYGRYPARDSFVAYLERYAEHHGIDVRFGVEVARVDRAGEEWGFETSAGPMQARYAVMATGFDAIPRLPEIPGLESFEGELIHAAAFANAADHAGRDVLIVGAGNTGVDIGGLLDAVGARVTMATRTPPNIFPRDLFGFPLQLSALPTERLPARLGDLAGRVTQRIAFGNLAAIGFPHPPEGFQSKFRNQLVGPAVDDGFVASLKAGRSRVVPTVERFEGAEAVLVGGERLKPDIVICATGYYRGLEPLVGHLGVLRPDGLPENFDTASDDPSAPRLYFAGFWGSPSGQIRIMPIHARRIARAAARDRKRVTPRPAA